MTFEKFQNRVVVKARLVAVTPIFVGARADSFKPGTINGSCVKDVYGRPYIPGSSLKGVLRAFSATISEDEQDQPGKSVVNKKYKTKSDRDDTVREAKENHREKYKDKSDDEILASLIAADSTRVELLFGSQVMAGKIKIADAIPVENRIAMEVRNGVAIDRDTRTAFSGALFDTEVVPSGTAFDFAASAENLTPEEASLFGKLMEYFAEGNITVGGRSRAGLGNVELRDVTVKIYGVAQGELESEDSSLGGIKEAVCKCLRN